ncbi:MAG: SAM-dependent methyltransferase [Steroidobacteraceae bacterium]|nr:SAM-dependent methyltransferase [Steroidobacteraceae bacterium]
MTAPTFKDHFSRQAADYSRYRPAYPSALIDYVASLAPSRSLAVDCATGNGQAAVALAEHFDHVIAVDASPAQLQQAQPHPGVRYERALAEALPVADGTVALVAVAQAIHWFDFDNFHAECRRVLMPGGVVAAWTYTVFRAGGAIDEVVDRFYHDTIGPYWPPEREYVQQGYRTIPFPWDEITPPAFQLQTEWTLEQVIGYFASWSSVQQYRVRHDGRDPLPAIERELASAWPVARTVRLDWPLYLRVGRQPRRL